ncbi:MAG: hypothetical protein ABGY22_05165 [Acidimicrobiales bacterium]
MNVHLNSTNAGYWGTQESDNSPSPINNDFLRIELQLDILNGCQSSCPGCFIPRNNKEYDLSLVYQTLSESSYYPDEIVIGPTDIFSASNFDELMDDPYLKKLYSISSIAFTSALEESYEDISVKLNRIWDIYEDVDRIKDIDFKIVLDLDMFLSNDSRIHEYNHKLSLFTQGSVQFRINYYKGIFDNISYNELAFQIQERYNSPVIITPNFLINSNSSGLVENLLESFILDMEEQDIEPQYQNLYTMFDTKFSGYGCSNYSFYNNEFYINPFIFDAVPQRSNTFKVEGINSDSMLQNISLSEDIECSDCQYLMSCAERNVPLYMNDRHLQKCILPRKYLHANN